MSKVLGRQILNFFFLVLRLSLDFIPDTIYKGSRFSQVFPKEDFKLLATWVHGVVVINFILILLPAEENLVFEERCYKRYSLMALGFCFVKIVLALLTKVIALHVRIFIAYVRNFCFEMLIWNIFLSF